MASDNGPPADEDLDDLDLEWDPEWPELTKSPESGQRRAARARARARAPAPAPPQFDDSLVDDVTTRPTPKRPPPLNVESVVTRRPNAPDSDATPATHSVVKRRPGSTNRPPASERPTIAPPGGVEVPREAMPTLADDDPSRHDPHARQTLPNIDVSEGLPDSSDGTQGE